MALVKEDLAANLKKYRKLAGLTINEVGERIGKSGKTVSAWENGRGQPDADMLIKLCGVYNVHSVADLLGSTSEAANVPAEPQKEKPVENDGRDMDEAKLLSLFRQLNTEGRERLLENADDMVKSGKYIKSDASDVAAKEA